ncbi:TPR repeat region-containing protein [Nocardia otitidiscaviarum]|uniref:TPR repeat region-containing protein n=1 Tax=Nocardia otitidiscaviarum TaxID=1823 RepID=UPI00189531B7|nr:hypothetical protein [Nocardia otitidiscaviarum]MBF6178432.1 hypothetical protein [Nocardia otitidiscaviarum]
MTETPPPSKSQVMNWNVDLASIATPAEKIAQGLRDAADNMDRTIDGMNWSGEGRNGADYRSDRERQQMRLLADQWDNLAEVGRNRQNSLGGLVSTARTTVTTVQGDGFDVAEDWTVTDRYNYPKAFAAISGDSDYAQSSRDQLTQLQTSRANDAQNNTVLLQRLAASIGAEDAATATDIRNTLNSIEQLAPASTTELSPADAEQDGKAIADGTATKEEIARITERLAKTGLTAEQLQMIENGQTVDLPPGELAYLQAFYGYAGKDGLLGLSEQLETDGSPEAQALQTYLANGLLTLSQEKVVTRDKDGNILDTGGMDKLDPEITELISTRPSLGGDLPDATTVSLAEEYRGGPADRSEYVSDLKTFGNLLASSSTGYDPGTKLGVELTRQGAHLAGLDDQGLLTQVGDKTIEQYVQVGTRNEDSNYALITGKGTDEIPGNGDNGLSAEQLLGPGYQRENVMMPLLSHEWDDDGAAVGKGMFGWIDDDARVEGEAPTVANQRAGEAAFGLAQILSDTEGSNLHERWLDMGIPEGGEDDSLGQINPELTRSMAEALVPYAGSLVGMPDDYTNTAGFGDLGGPIETVRVLSVLDGDIVAGTTINGAMLSESMRMNETYASMVTSGKEVDPDLMGEYANRLTWAVDAGLGAEYAERDADTDAHNDRISDKKTLLNAAYTAAQISIGGLSAPAAGVMALTAFPQADIVDALGGAEQETEPRKPAYREGIGPINYEYNQTKDGSGSHREYAFLQSLVQQGTIDVSTLDPSLTKKVGDSTFLATYDDYQNTVRQGSQDGQITTKNAVTNALTAAGLNETIARAYLTAANNTDYRERYTNLIANGPTEENTNDWIW